ncbi:MAG: hypothetical protein PVJ57_00505 [Phycisphaerae bacterium]
MTKRRLLAVGAALLFLGSAAGLYLTADMRRHNRFLVALQRSLAALPLPEGTTRLAADSRVGLLAGNGNHCDYIVAEAHATTQTPDQITAHYAHLAIPNPNGQNSFNVEIAFFRDDEPPDLDVHAALNLRVADHADRTRYVLFIRLIGYEASGLDPRCH